MPSWLQMGGQIRGKVELPSGDSFVKNSSDGYLLTRLRLNMFVRPVKWLRFWAETQDTRAYGYDAPIPASARNPFDLRAAYAEIGVGEKVRGFMVRAGRQELTLGAGRVLGSGDWGNTTRTFDMVRGVFFRPGLRSEWMAGSPVLTDGTRFDRHKAGEHFYASYNTLDKLIPRGVVEPYFIAKTAVKIGGELGSKGDAAYYTGGLRLAGKLPGRMDYSAETLYQWGTWAADNIKGSFGTYTVGWTVVATGWKPRVSGDYNFGSGDRSTSDRRRGIDVLYGANQPFLSVSGMLGWRNIRSLRAGTDFSPTKTIKIQVDYRNAFLATTADSLYGTGGTAVLTNRAATSRHIGQEFDVMATWNAGAYGKGGVGLGRLFAGEYLRQSGKGSGYLYPYLLWSRRF